MADSAPPKIAFEALTYDDVLLLPAYSEVLPRDCDTGTRLTPTIRLHTPLISAAMDTVTESEMAIALAQEGGLGIIHKNMSIKAQAEQVRSLSVDRLGHVLGRVPTHLMTQLDDALRLHLQL